MAKFITTKAISANLEDIIKKAEKEIYLISYNITIGKSYIPRIKAAVKKGVKIYIVSCKDVAQETFDDIAHLDNVFIKKLDFLHAKMFMNESHCIVGSMNFSEASERNHNIETGLLLTKAKDEELFKEVLEECKHIYTLGGSFENSVKKLKKPIKKISSKSITNKTKKGTCISCEKSIPLNTEKPFCGGCYKEWQNGEIDFGEACHICGNEEITYLDTPACKPCWKKNKHLF